MDAATVDAEAVIGTECDVYAPCATGGVLSAATIPRLRCRAVAGAANNQLAEPHDAELLAERGILYAPDFVINAGGVLHLAGYETLRWTEEQMAARLAGIGDTLLEVYDAADREGITTDAAANRLARSRLDAARPHRQTNGFSSPAPAIPISSPAANAMLTPRTATRTAAAEPSTAPEQGVQRGRSSPGPRR